MKEKIRQFMIGRYGTDGLNQFLNIASLVLILVYILTRLPLLLYVGVVLLGFCYYRMFSRNISKRTEENYKYYAVKDRMKALLQTAAASWARPASMNRETMQPAAARRSQATLIFASCPATSRPPSVVNSARRSGTRQQLCGRMRSA